MTEETKPKDIPPTRPPPRNQAEAANRLIGFGGALSTFGKEMRKFGNSSAQILFVVYPDGSMGPYLNGALTPSMLIQAARFLMQAADEQVARIEAEMHDRAAAASPIIKPNGGVQ